MSVSRKRVLVVSFEGADWRVIQPLLDAGELPHLDRLVGRGIMGNLAAPQPLVDPMLAASLATGTSPEQHGIIDFVEPGPEGEVRLATASSRGAPALWNVASAAGKHVLVVGWPQVPAERVAGTFVTRLFARVDERSGSSPPPAGSVHPKERGRELAELRIHPEEIGAEELLAFVPEAGRIDQERDRSLAALAVVLAETATLHNVATHELEHRPWELAVLSYDILDALGHLFAVHHPPTVASVGGLDASPYAGVLRAAYRFSDSLLGRLVELAGDETTVLLVSSHGFHSDHLRPGVSPSPRNDIRWHREQGVVVLAGPDVRRDEWLWGARLADVAPTVLTLLGLPARGELLGQPLTRAFVRPPPAEHAPRPNREIPDSTEAALDGQTLEAERQRLLDRGFLADSDFRESATRKRRRLRRALVLVHERKPEAAVELLTMLHEEEPSSDEIALHLARCFQDLGRHEESRRLVEDVAGRGLPRGKVELFLSTLAYAEGDFDTALEHLLTADAAEPGQPSLHCHIGEAYLKKKSWEEAERAFTKALELDGDCTRAHHGLAVAALARNRFARAAEHALDAIGLRFDEPFAHYHLGVALTRSGDPTRGRQAFETCLRLDPKNQPARRWLQELLADNLGTTGVRDA